MRDRGFLLAGPALYAAIGAGVIIVGLSVAVKIQSARLGAAQEELAACRASNAVLNDQINRQNEAVKALETEGQERQKRAQGALEAARKGQAKAQGEIARLKAAKPTVKGDCHAGQAVQRVREGLKP